MSIRSLVTPGEFDPEALAAMVEAFDAAYEGLDDWGQLACSGQNVHASPLIFQLVVTFRRNA
jgi:hypothetical protein